MKFAPRGRPAGTGRRRVAVATVLSLAVTTLVVLAVRYDGEPIHDVDLNDGSVWVTKPGMIGRLNSQVQELDLGLETSTTTEKVFQEAVSVQAVDSGGGNPESVVHLVDPLRGTSEKVSLPSTYQAVTGKGVVAILDDKTGNAWLRRQDQLEGFSEETPPDFTVSQRGNVAMSKRGTAMFLDRARGEVQAWSVDVSGSPVKDRTWDFDTEFVDDATMTVVGETPVVAQSGEVLLPGEDAVELGEDLVLQEVGPESDDVYAATRGGLSRIPLGGGEAEEVSGLEVEGTPAPPAVVAGCVHGAWADPGTDNYVRLCEEAERFAGEVPAIAATARILFRSNRDVVVLNDISTGDAWLVQQEGLALVDNWDSVDPRATSPQKTELADEDESNARNQPPQAIGDEFGARPGSTVLLPVTLNDRDADGDILTVSQTPASVGGVSFAVVGNGTQVQANVPDTARGTVTFSYEINDGRAQNRPSVADVQLTIHGRGDKAPYRMDKQRNELRVANGYSASVNVLPAWIDPEGDTLVLTGATSKDGTLTFRPDGTIDFTDDGNGPGKARIDFEVRGGERNAKGFVDVTVVAEEDATPQAVADRFTGDVNSAILLEPLKNDTDSFGGAMTLPRLTLPDGEVADLDYDTQGGTGTFRASRHGTYYLEYEAAGSNGRTAKPERIRVDVAADSDENHLPVATRDVAVVPADDAALVDVLANDTDLDNDVLVVQGIDVPTEFRGIVTASLVDKRFVRVETTAPLKKDQKPVFEYLLSDGRGEQVRGTVSVTPGETGQNRPPIARPDHHVARAGTIINVPVLDNDEDPDGDRLTVEQADLEDGANGSLVSDGTVPVVATGSSIRILVPDDPDITELSLSYGVRDSERLRADAELTLVIRPDTPKGNQAPQPRPIVDRTVVGQRIRVPVDAFGADPDGDPVVFTGVDLPPQLGRIGRTGTNWFEYEPFEDTSRTGTDTFRVLVSDGYGKTGVAQVRIGVVPRNEENQPPAALDDELLVKPGRTIRYPVLENDSDPDGDRLALDRSKFAVPEGIEARPVGQGIEIQVPGLGGKSEVVAAAQYAATDGLGTPSTGLLEVTARDDAPDHAPLAQDDVARPAELAGKRAGDTIDVDVLANDGDLDGARSDLVVEPMRPAISTVVDGRLRVTLGKDSRVVPYRVTDATDQSSFGFVYVPGTATMPPTLDTSVVPVEVVAGEPERIDLDDVVVVRPGRTPRIARLDLLESVQGDVQPRGDQGLTFDAPPAYHGPASVTVPVTDGEDLNDPSGLLSEITVPINVLPAENEPPEARSVSVAVLAGSEPTTIDLGRLATDPNPDDELSYSVAEGQEGLDASIEKAGELVLTANDTAPSSQQELTLNVRDEQGASTTATVSVEVIGLPDENAEQQVAVPQPPMTLGPLSFPDGAVGKPLRVDVTEAVLTDPFPKKTKKVVRAAVEAGKGTVSSSGSTLTITPSAASRLVVTYQLSDGSGVAARAAVGQVVVVAAGKPARPGRPRAKPVGARSVSLAWPAAKDNGLPIEKYVVSYAGGSRDCTSTSCTIDGLTPGRAYAFSVAAVNELGAGPRSQASNVVKPDRAPGPMAAPVIRSSFADRNGNLQLAWSPPREQEGSEIRRYEFQSSPRTSGGAHVDRTMGPGARRMRWTGLRNGTRYTFKVRAVNDAGPGPWSSPSIATAPFTRPSVMAPPTLQAMGNDGTDQTGYLEVHWPAVTAPANGHDRVSSYSVRLLRNGSVVTTVRVAASKTTRGFSVRNGYTWTAQVRAANRAGDAGWSGRSAARVTWDKASAPTELAVSAHCYERSVCARDTDNYIPRLKWRTPARNGGFPVIGYRYVTGDGGSGTFRAPTQRSGVMTSARVRFAGASWPSDPGRRVRLYPITEVPGQGRVQGISRVSGPVFHPWAKPHQPIKTAVYARSITFNCDRGNGRSVNPVVVDGYTHNGYSVERSNNAHGCYRYRLRWSSIPVGQRRCAVIYLKNTLARSVNSNRICTPVMR